MNITRFCLLKKRNSIYKVKNNNDALPKVEVETQTVK